MTEGVTITYLGAGDQGRRVRFEALARPSHPEDGWFERVVEVREDGGWRETGREVVRHLEIETSDGQRVSEVTLGP